MSKETASDRYTDNCLDLHIMINTISEHVDGLIGNENPNWCDVSEVARMKSDIEDLYNRITGKGEYAEVMTLSEYEKVNINGKSIVENDDPMAGCEAPEDEDKPMKTYTVNINGKKAVVTIPED